MMDQSWLTKLTPQTAVIVPTHSLGTILQELIAQCNIRSEMLVWETPNIIAWQEYLQLLWQSNRSQLAQAFNVHTLINNQQSLLLWTKVIEDSRRKERELTLLNVQQTARAAQRSWRMLHDWQIDQQALKKDVVADAQQFNLWCDQYKAVLSKRGFIDEQTLITCLLQDKQQQTQPFKELIFYAYDLITNSQQRLIDKAENQGVQISFQTTTTNLNVSNESDSPLVNSNTIWAKHAQYHCYSSSNQQLVSAFKAARDLVEVNADAKINIVIPDLQVCQSEVRELAREIFYPGKPPLQAQQENLVYRFSLGEPLNRWPAIETALILINLLKGHITLTELSFLFRNQFLTTSRHWRAQSRAFEQWLQQHRIDSLLITDLTELYKQSIADQESQDQESHDTKQSDQATFSQFLEGLIDLLKQQQDLLAEQRREHGYAALSLTDWLERITQWLNFWGWSTAVKSQSMNSIQYQLQQRWQRLLQEYAALELIQTHISLARTCEIIQQMTRDTVFLPKAAAAPILISGVYEAIGRPVDLCLLTGMDDRYPAPPPSDAFIANSLRDVPQYPASKPQSHYAQSLKVINSLLGSADKVIISYAKQDQDDSAVEHELSAIFRQQEFKQIATPLADDITAQNHSDLEQYQDTQGPAWQTNKVVRGGSAIFKNQSNCAFKAFITHQLGVNRDDEAEFGLDSLDRGNIVHHLLDKAWEKLQTQATLTSMIEQGTLTEFVSSTVTEVLEDPELNLLGDKKILLKHEHTRLVNLLQEWLLVDANRPVGFAVVEREERRYTEFAGIGFHFIIDRLDLSDDGHSLIIDYKTGTVSRRDWQGDRIREPQLPLYAVALEQLKKQPASGIAYAKVKHYDCHYEELALTDLFKKKTRYSENYEEQWQTAQQTWPQYLEQLAKDFLSGKAEVDPIEEATCNFCNLASVCRISQLRGQNDVATNETECDD